MLSPEQKQLVEENVHVAKQVARILTRRSRSFQEFSDDIFQEAMVGLTLAARTFRASEGVKFSTYAWVACITQIIKEGRGIVNVVKTQYVPKAKRTEADVYHVFTMPMPDYLRTHAVSSTLEEDFDAKRILSNIRERMKKRLQYQAGSGQMERNLDIFFESYSGDVRNGMSTKYGISRESIRQIKKRCEKAFQSAAAELREEA